MRELNIGKFLRLKGAIEGAIDEAPAANAGTMLMESYNRYLEEALTIIPEGHHDELIRVCPAFSPKQIEDLKQDLDPQTDLQVTTQGKVMLRALAGFFEGYIKETEFNQAVEEVNKRLGMEKAGEDQITAEGKGEATRPGTI